MSSPDKKGNLIKTPCIEHECVFFIQAQGMHPQTGEMISEFDCTDNWQTVFSIENARRQIETGASIDSFRNESIKVQGATLKAALQTQFIPAECVEELPSNQKGISSSNLVGA